MERLWTAVRSTRDSSATATSRGADSPESPLNPRRQPRTSACRGRLLPRCMNCCCIEVPAAVARLGARRVPRQATFTGTCSRTTRFQTVRMGVSWMIVSRRNGPAVFDRRFDDAATAAETRVSGRACADARANSPDVGDWRTSDAHCS